MSPTVADEINNPLEAMTNLIFLAKGASGATPEVVETLQMAEHELARVSMIAKRTLGFYREYKVPEQIDLPRVIDNVLTLYSGKLSSKNLFVTRDLKPCPTIVGIEGGCGRLSRTSCQTPSTQLQPMEEFISLARPMSPEST
jgi:C4-dicarboxylate-specific signal transduction histidine kinase